MVAPKRTLSLRDLRLHETAEADDLTTEGGGRQQSLTKAALNDLTLGEGG